MGTKYSTNLISGYNTTPPPDDGSTTTSNDILWSYIKGKLADPIKTLAESINTDVVTHIDLGPTAISSGYTTTAADNGKTLLISSTIPEPLVDLMDLDDVPDGYHVRIINENAASVNRVTLGIDGDSGFFSFTSGQGANELWIEVGKGGLFMASPDKTYYMTISTSGLLLAVVP